MSGEPWDSMQLQDALYREQAENARLRQRVARLDACWDEAQRGLMRVVVRADTDPTNLPSAMLASDFRGLAMEALARSRAALEAEEAG